MQERFPDDLVVMTLNVDFDGEGQVSQELIDQISQVLADQGMTCSNYIATTPMEAVLGEFELFGLPAALLYDRTGAQIRKFDGEVEIKNAVGSAIRGQL